MKLNFEEYEKKQEGREMLVFLVTIAILCILALVLFACNADAQIIKPADINVEKLADAIYIAEGGEGYDYGIKSVKYEDEAEARRICINTIRNNIDRYKRYGNTRYGSYLAFLQSRYCPIGARNDSKGLNKNWLKNVRSIYLKLVRGK